MTNIETDLEIREIKPTEYYFLKEMLYQAIQVSQVANLPILVHKS